MTDPTIKTCIVKNCTNRSNEGLFLGDLCAPCYEFITQGIGKHSQAYRNCLYLLEERIKIFNQKLELFYPEYLRKIIKECFNEVFK